MDQFVLIPYYIYQSQSTLPKKPKLEQKQEKEEIVPKNFDSIYRLRLSQSENIILDNRDTKESIVGFVCALKRKNTDFPDIYFTILEATQIPPKLVANKNAKAKDRGTWIPFKI